MKNWLIGITPAATAYFNWMLLVINQADLQNFASFEGFATNKLATYFLFTKQLFQVALSCNFNCLHNTTSLRNGRTKINSVSCREICTALKLWADFLKSSVGQETLQHFPPPFFPAIELQFIIRTLRGASPSVFAPIPHANIAILVHIFRNTKTQFINIIILKFYVFKSFLFIYQSFI